MKVVVMTNYWKESPGGGVKVYLTNLVEELRKMGANVLVIFREGKDNENIQIKGSRFLFPLKAFIRLLRIKPNVIHSHGPWYTLFPAIMFKILFRKTRVIHTFHTSAKEQKLPKWFLFIFQLFLNRCNCVTFVSEALKKEFEEIYGLNFKKFSITYGGVKKVEVSQRDRIDFINKFELQNKWPILLMQGFTSSKYKAEGAKLAILAIKELKENYPGICLVVTGKGRYLNELISFAEDNNIREHVIFPGVVENPFVPLEICDIYLHISLAEGLPLALLEAMIAEKPIIATAVGGIPEGIINGENGLLVDPQSKKIAEKIVYLLENPEFCKKIAKNAKKTAEERFSWENSARKFMELYHGG